MINVTLILLIFTILLKMIMPNKILKIKSYSFALENAYLLIAFLVLMFFSCFRGEFSADYGNYSYLFTITKDKDIFTILTEQEPLFYLLVKFVASINFDVNFFFSIISILTLLFYYFYIKNNSKNFLISLIIFVVFDNYVISFTLIRNVLAASFFMYSIKYVENKNLFKWIISILLIGCIHKSAYILLPFYWFLDVDMRKRKNIYISLGIIILIAVLYSFDELIYIVQNILGYDYDSLSFGMGEGGLGSMLKTVFLFFLVILNSRYIDYSQTNNRIYFNGIIYALVFQILTAKILMLQRFSFYFTGFFIVIIPLIYSKMNAKERKLFIFFIIIFALLYALLFRSADYYFIFNKVT